MPQIPVPPDPGIAPEDRKSIECWPASEGWCSACGHERASDRYPVVHLGKSKASSCAFCVVCIDRMHDAMHRMLAVLEPCGPFRRDDINMPALNRKGWK